MANEIITSAAVRETDSEKPTALCLGGGGAKGAFQIGAWQALQEAGLISGIKAAAGCSVGALNAALFALGDLDYAKQIWSSIRPADLLAPGTDGAFFSRDGLIRIINALPLERISNSPVRVHVSVQHQASGEPVYFELNGLPNESIKTLLLASSAIPHIYSPEHYLGTEYLDCGRIPQGYVCLSPVYHQGHRRIVLVSLKPVLPLDPVIEYPDADVTVIKPLKNMGNLLTGTLNFAPERIAAHLEQGYADAKAALEGFTPQPQTKEEMNAALVQKMTKLFPNGALLADFIQGFGSRLAPNIKAPTLGGNVWYDNIFEVDGWRLQQQRTAGLKSHYRILDPKNVRAAWVLSPQTLLDALCSYENAQQNSR